MVERYTLTSLDELPSAFGAAAPPGANPRFNIAPLQSAPIALGRPGSELSLARWGLLPPWRGHGGKRGPHVLHAPLGDIEQVPLLRNAFKSQRCLVIADGFFAWWRAGKKPQPFWVHPTTDSAPGPARPGARSRAIAFAGLAATNRDDHQLSFAILVGPSAPLVATYAPTMPVVVPAAGYATWLTGTREAARALLTSALDAWRAGPVSTRVRSGGPDDAKWVE